MIAVDLVDELSDSDHLPALAIARAALDPSAIAEPVLDALESAARGDLPTVRQENLLFWGLHVLAGRRDQRGFAPLMRLMRLPEERLEHLLGDAITMTLPKVAAGMYDGSADLLFQTIADGAVEQFARHSLFGAATFLTWNGRIDEARMVAFLERFDDERLAEPENFAWDGWLESIALLGLRSLAPRAMAAFQDGRIDPTWTDRRHFRAALDEAGRNPRDGRRFARERLGYIEDIARELEWLAKPATKDTTDAMEQSSWPGLARQAPAINPMRHIGRNDPCPCGSGKKAKRCCLA